MLDFFLEITAIRQRVETAALCTIVTRSLPGSAMISVCSKVPAR